MKQFLLAINHGYYFWGTSVYVGLLWSLHFIFYPSWGSITPESVQAHFMGPVNSATAFFTFVVPPMLFAGLVMIWSEWRSNMRVVAIAAYASLLSMMVVGYWLIRPINETIAQTIFDKNLLPGPLKEQLVDWMFYNDMRLVIMTIMWLILLFYFYKRKA